MQNTTGLSLKQEYLIYFILEKFSSFPELNLLFICLSIRNIFFPIPVFQSNEFQAVFITMLIYDRFMTLTHLSLDFLIVL